MALSKPNRLKHRKDFSRVYQHGLRRNSPNLTLRALHGSKFFAKKSLPEGFSDLEPQVPSQIGISISLKVSKRAVVRNRIKRQIRAALRQLLPRLTAGWKLVIIVRPQAVECDYFQFLQELEQLLLDAEVLNGN
ncbi:ribonuclease P protein component [Phormidesmis priestleyi ULC007]|uniref:Ribonuclease P protein component n=1 Tax=Phormidesmis priestleyi ULC007 TaxID=1920490 RepID=A0A2T1D5X1_9CYAN|nr:ribonuclease P protein component [Phormidesmis priestleyi]PSB15831.1 ribonuclease P protein component [Phormidesmis priestleyi ULC007]PZO46128.1 MAG: ribonuclease P protein component [Phormidesmis priestleyi]